MPNDFLEKTLEEIIYENRSVIHSRGLPRFRNIAFQQCILPSGRKIDILAFDLFDGHIVFDIYELKKDYINTDAICQAYNYLEELMGITSGYFKSFEATIIMVGKRYDPLSILNGMATQVKVFTYEYAMDGIRFNKAEMKVTKYHPNESFSLGVWSWGMEMIHYPSGMPTSMNIQTCFENYVSRYPEFIHSVRDHKNSYLNPQKLLPAPTQFLIPEKKLVKTEIFPEQPAWSKEFLSGVPFDDPFEDMEQDLSDYELEEEDDTTDFEHTGDHEEDPDEVWIVNEWDGKPPQIHPIIGFLNPDATNP